MKHTKHKITSSIQDKIYLTANGLPKIAKYVGGKPVYKSTQVKGSELSKSDMKPGDPLILNATYQVNRLQYEDHCMNMIRGVQKEGPIFIDHYSAAIKAQHASFLRADKESKSVTNKFLNKINKLISWVKKKK